MKLPSIDPKTETKKITSFIKETLKKEGFKNAVIGVSGGIDSITSLYLLVKTIPVKNIFPVYLYYFSSSFRPINELFDSVGIPLENRNIISIKSAVDVFGSRSRVRLGNIMARVRMIFLYDLAKKHNALVCGTENKSEHLLSYFTRFGDEASDFEPIRHLYKTQVNQLANYLNVPKSVIQQKPTAGLWAGQTDEGDFGFTYKEADQVLYLYFEKELSVEQIKKQGFKNAKKIIEWSKKNFYKHHTPYTL